MTLVNTKIPVIAIMYDFDKTLCTKNMQEYSFIPNLGLSAGEFWKAAEKLSIERQMDGILAYMWEMLVQSKKNSMSIHRSDFVELGKALKFYSGVTEWFERINKFGEEQGVKIEHYIISSGLREIIEGSSIYKEFTDIFACEYLYDENDIACWPKNVVNYTTKTQFLFRINKGGHSIAVYQKGKKELANELIRNHRVNYIAPANYKEGNALDLIIKDVITEMAVKDRLVRLQLKQKKESDK